MATFRKVGKRWRAEIRKKGLYQSKTFPTKMQASKWAEITEKQLDHGYQQTGFSLKDAFDRFAREISPLRKGERWEKIFLNAISRDGLAEHTFKSVNREVIKDWRDRRLSKVKPATVKREMNLLSAVFQIAKAEWGWTTDNPVREVKRPSDSKPRDRRPTQDEIDRVTLALGFDGEVTNKIQEVAVAFLLAIETAMRLGEICSLSKDRIYLQDRYVSLIDTKNGTNRDVPLSSQAVALLELVPEGFSIQMESASALFRKACKAAKIEGLRFHDSRREALTRLSKKVDVMDLARISGHKDLKTLLNVYYAPTASELAKLLD